jgi:hypothetical protein
MWFRRLADGLTELYQALTTGARSRGRTGVVGPSPCMSHVCESLHGGADRESLFVLEACRWPASSMDTLMRMVAESLPTIST